MQNEMRLPVGPAFDLMKALHGFSREGRNVDFPIPAALIRRWDGAQ